MTGVRKASSRNCPLEIFLSCLHDQRHRITGKAAPASRRYRLLASVRVDIISVAHRRRVAHRADNPNKIQTIRRKTWVCQTSRDQSSKQNISHGFLFSSSNAEGWYIAVKSKPTGKNYHL